MDLDLKGKHILFTRVSRKKKLDGVVAVAASGRPFIGTLIEDFESTALCDLVPKLFVLEVSMMVVDEDWGAIW